MHDDTRRGSGARATIGLSVALCLALPLVWNALWPSRAGTPITIALGPPRPDDALSLPQGRLEASRESEGLRELSPWRTFRFELAAAGRYSLYGISSSDDSWPLELRLDGRRISNRAFDRVTGSIHDDFETQRIATGIEIGVGSHVVELAGPRLSARSYALELRRERPLGVLRYLALAALAAIGLGLRRLLIARFEKPPGRRLVATASFAIAALALPPLLVAAHGGRPASPVDAVDAWKSQALDELEAHLDSPEHRQRGTRFSVAVLGDSTHRRREDSGAMRRSIVEQLPAADRETIEIYGAAGLGFSGFDYYLLLNRLVPENPDLVVVPVNLRSFGDQWIDAAVHDYGPVERHLRLDELIRAQGASVGRRRISWERLLLHRIDEATSSGRIALFLRRAKPWLRAEMVLLAENGIPGWLRRPLPESVADVALPRPAVWPRQITGDHPLLRFFQLSNRLAQRRGIEILYYTVQFNLDAMAEQGQRIHLQERYARLRREIAGAPGIHFLDLSTSIRPPCSSTAVST